MLGLQSQRREKADNAVMPDSTHSDPAFDDAHPTEERRERIRLETPRHRIEGSLMLARDGYRSRVSDMLNASERDFLTLTDVTLVPLDGGPTERHAFMAIARVHIVYVVAPGPDTSSA
jgi:hypothetical protein